MTKAENTAQLNAVAEAINAHPRTILRHVTGDSNAYWTEGHNPDLDVDLVALAMSADDAVVSRVLRGEDKFLKPEEAAAHVSMLEGKERPITVRAFRIRGYSLDLKAGNIARYSRNALSRVWEDAEKERQRVKAEKAERT